MKATQTSVAKKAGVSEATVSRVLNNSPLVHQATAERVRRVIQELGYAPSSAARNLSRQKTDTIGLVFHQISSGFFADVLSSIENTCRSNGYHIITAISRDLKEERETCYSMLEEARVDGVIVLDSNLSDESIGRLKEYRQPFVLIERDPGDPSINTISVNNRDGAAHAVRHLLDLDYDNLLILLGPEGAQDAQLRKQGCEDVLKDSGKRCAYADGFYSPDRALEAFRSHRETHGLPRAVFALNDAMALAVLKELRLTGVRVPDEVAVVGFDGIESADFVGLTTVQTPIASLGQEAVNMLIEQIDDPESPAKQVRLDAELIVRATCGGKSTERL